MSHEPKNNKELIREIIDDSLKVGKNTLHLLKKTTLFTAKKIDTILRPLTQNLSKQLKPHWKKLIAGTLSATVAYEGTQRMIHTPTPTRKDTYQTGEQRKKIPTTLLPGNSTYAKRMRQHETWLKNK